MFLRKKTTKTPLSAHLAAFINLASTGPAHLKVYGAHSVHSEIAPSLKKHPCTLLLPRSLPFCARSPHSATSLQQQLSSSSGTGSNSQGTGGRPALGAAVSLLRCLPRRAGRKQAPVQMTSSRCRPARRRNYVAILHTLSPTESPTSVTSSRDRHTPRASLQWPAAYAPGIGAVAEQSRRRSPLYPSTASNEVPGVHYINTDS